MLKPGMGEQTCQEGSAQVGGSGTVEERSGASCANPQAQTIYASR